MEVFSVCLAGIARCFKSFFLLDLELGQSRTCIRVCKLCLLQVLIGVIAELLLAIPRELRQRIFNWDVCLHQSNGRGSALSSGYLRVGYCGIVRVGVVTQSSPMRTDPAERSSEEVVGASWSTSIEETGEPGTSLVLSGNSTALL